MRQEHLRELLDCFAGRTVAVVGDLMLDRYVWGRASRISQEAPVPVVHVNDETEAPGGAANVVRNLLCLRAGAVVFGVVGGDEAGEKLCGILADEGADISGIQRIPDRPTTVKTRVLAGNQQVVRVDRETADSVDAAVKERLLDQLGHMIRSGSLEAVILEDYAKGLLTLDLVREIAELCRQNGVLVAMDPHPSHAYGVPGIDLFTPNRSEAFALAARYYQAGKLPLAGDVELLEVGKTLQETWGMRVLLITLGGQGMALFTPDAAPVHIPTRAQEVFDVSGAGDTVIAVCVLGLLAGGSPEAAAQLANHAAGIVVAEVGTAAVSAVQLRRVLGGGDG